MYSDILAQTFYVDTPTSGCFLTSIDIFFAFKDQEDDNPDQIPLPVMLEIRDTTNRYPGTNVLPFSKVRKLPREIITSQDGSVATNFKFESPVFVNDDTEYAIVLYTQSTEYAVWVSQIGEAAKVTGSLITEQPNSGQLFLSQTSGQWMPNYLQDLKFKLYRAKFDTTKPATINFLNDVLGAKRLSTNPFKTYKNSNIVRVMHKNHSMPAGSKVTFRNAVGNFNIESAALNAQHTIGNVLLDSYTITLPGANTASQSAYIGSNRVLATEDIVYDKMYPSITFDDFADTDVTLSAYTTPNTLGGTRSSTPIDVDFNSENIMDSPKSVKSNENQTGVGAARRTLKLSATMATLSDYISPIIDTRRVSVKLISNRVGNVNTDNGNFPHDTRTIVSANTKIAFTGNSITTSHPDVAANLLQIYNSGKTITISGAANPANNVTVVVSGISDDDAGNATISVFDKTFTTETAGAPVTITCRDLFIDERAAQGGSSVAKYVTKKIEFANSSEFMKVLFLAYMPAGTDIDLYYRSLPAGSGDDINTFNWTYVPQPVNMKKGLPYYVDVEYDVDTPSFQSVMIKLVFRSSDTTKVPVVKDLRIIACP